VNLSVNQMDQVTQQNAAMVEEATAASHALSHEADELTSLVGKFNLGEVKAAPGRQRASAPLRSSATTTRSTSSRSSAPARASAPMTSGANALAVSAPASAPSEDDWTEF
jgi:methyl-accepting chemotaxis protein